VNVGDEVVLIGSQGDQTIDASEIASKIGTINYEVVCSIGPRVPRRYAP
jgi:alanine racemase